MQNEFNQIAEIRLRHHQLRNVEKVITSGLNKTDHRGPLRRRLAVVNAKFDTGFPPTADPEMRWSWSTAYQGGADETAVTLGPMRLASRKW